MPAELPLSIPLWYSYWPNCSMNGLFLHFCVSIFAEYIIWTLVTLYFSVFISVCFDLNVFLSQTHTRTHTLTPHLHAHTHAQTHTPRHFKTILGRRQPALSNQIIEASVLSGEWKYSTHYGLCVICNTIKPKEEQHTLSNQQFATLKRRLQDVQCICFTSKEEL